MSTRTDIEKLQLETTCLNTYIIAHRKVLNDLKSEQEILDKQINRIDETLDLVLAHLGVKRVDIEAHSELHEVTDDELEDLHSSV